MEYTRRFPVCEQFHPYLFNGNLRGLTLHFWLVLFSWGHTIWRRSFFYLFIVKDRSKGSFPEIMKYLTGPLPVINEKKHKTFFRFLDVSFENKLSERCSILTPRSIVQRIRVRVK